MVPIFFISFSRFHQVATNPHSLPEPTETQANFYGSNSSGLSSAAKPPAGVYPAPTTQSVHGVHTSSHGSPGTTASASKPLYGGQPAGVSGTGGVGGAGGPGSMGGMQQGGQQPTQQVWRRERGGGHEGSVRELFLEGVPILSGAYIANPG